MDDDVDYRVVLDPSAMLSYANGHIHVGELIADLTEEDIVVGLPAVALLDAHARVPREGDGRLRLGVLTGLARARPMELGSSEAAEASSIVPLVSGDLAVAHTVWAAVKYDAYYLTTDRAPASVVVQENKIIVIPKGDA